MNEGVAPAHRAEVIQAILDRVGADTFLEIGTRGAGTMSKVRAKRKIGVDPAVRLGRRRDYRWKLRRYGGFRNGPLVYAMESDDFFARHGGLFRERKIDVALVDGLHTYSQALRDVENCLMHLQPQGLIVMHDCRPRSARAAAPTEQLAKSMPGYDHAWNGDVYKAVARLRATRRDLRVCTLDCDHGLGLVWRGVAEEMLDLSVEEIERLDYEQYALREAEILNLRPPEYFRTVLDEWR